MSEFSSNVNAERWIYRLARRYWRLRRWWFFKRHGDIPTVVRRDRASQP